MNLNEIKGSFFGYSKKAVCQYITEINELNDAEKKVMAEKTKADTERLLGENDTLKKQLKDIKETNSKLYADIEELKGKINSLEHEKSAIEEKYDALYREAGEIKEQSKFISTAILNAEKCADELIGDAKSRADILIEDAKDKVKTEAEKLSMAKRYIEDLRSEISVTLKNIDTALKVAADDISSKRDSVIKGENNTNNKSESVKERFEILEKNIFKRA